MITQTESLLKYNNPVLIKTRAERKSPKGRHLRVSPRSPDDTAVTPSPPKLRCAFIDGSGLITEAILHMIFPPREWTVGNEIWVQKVSSAPCTRADIVRLQELLYTKLQQTKARQTGICPERRELYCQCFDELIRQVTISSDERGLLLLQVRNEIDMTFNAYHSLHVSSLAFGMRKAMYAENGKIDLNKRIADLENEIQDLTKQLNEQKVKHELLEKTEAEMRRVSEQNFTKEIRLLEEKNQQLLMQLEAKFTPMK